MSFLHFKLNFSKRLQYDLTIPIESSNNVPKQAGVGCDIVRKATAYWCPWRSCIICNTEPWTGKAVQESKWLSSKG